MPILEWLRAPRHRHRQEDNQARERLAHGERSTRELEEKVRRLEYDSAVFRRTAQQTLRRTG